MTATSHLQGVVLFGAVLQGRLPARMMRQLSISSAVAAAPAAAAAALAANTSRPIMQQQQQLQQQSPPAAGSSSSSCTWTAQLELLQADVTNPGLINPEPWRAAGLNPGCDLAACIEVIEHLEPQAAEALGHSVLSGLRPKTAVFTTPNWEYNEVLRQVRHSVSSQVTSRGDHLACYFHCCCCCSSIAAGDAQVMSMLLVIFPCCCCCCWWWWLLLMLLSF
jgi:hypothetical protein